jgi:glycosyltransferase involved in cell wall biosynthesis
MNKRIRNAIRVLFTTNIPSPYRVDFFNELGKYCKLTVLFERKFANDRAKEWIKLKNINFSAIFLRGMPISNDMAFCPDVIRYLNPKNYDIICIGMYSSPTSILAIEYMKLKNIPFFLNSDGGFIKRDSSVMRIIKKYFISSAFAWLSTGKVTTEYLSHYGACVDRILIYPFTSLWQRDIIERVLSESEKLTIRYKLGMSERKIILSIGQFIYRKGFDILLEASRYLDDDIGIYIIGGKPTSHYLEIVKKYRLANVHFMNFIDKEGLKKYYQASDIFVLPTREDIWGLVVNEALANGLPVITTNRCIAGLELINNGENGFIIPTEDPLSLARAIKNVLIPDVNLKMSANALKTIRSYNIEQMAKVCFEHFIKYV